MSDELHIVSMVTLLDAVHTDGVAVCCVASVTPAKDILGFFMYVFCRLVYKPTDEGNGTALQPVCRHVLPVKIVHWVAGVT